MSANVEKKQTNAIPAGLIDGIEVFTAKEELYISVNGLTTKFGDSSGAIQQLFA